MRVDDGAHAIAIGRREAARIELDAVDQPRVQQADGAVEILEMKRLVQSQAVQQNGGLVGLAAANRPHARDAVGGRAGQALHGPQRFIRQARHRLHFVLGQKVLGRDVSSAAST